MTYIGRKCRGNMHHNVIACKLIQQNLNFNFTFIFAREKRTADHPQTPDKTRVYSRRAFDGLIRIWRKELHKFDPRDPYEATHSEWLKIIGSRHQTE